MSRAKSASWGHREYHGGKNLEVRGFGGHNSESIGNLTSLISMCVPCLNGAIVSLERIVLSRSTQIDERGMTSKYMAKCNEYLMW